MYPLFPSCFPSSLAEEATRHSPSCNRLSRAPRARWCRRARRGTSAAFRSRERSAEAARTPRVANPVRSTTAPGERRGRATTARCRPLVRSAARRTPRTATSPTLLHRHRSAHGDADQSLGGNEVAAAVTLTEAHPNGAIDNMRTDHGDLIAARAFRNVLDVPANGNSVTFNMPTAVVSAATRSARIRTSLLPLRRDFRVRWSLRATTVTCSRAAPRRGRRRSPRLRSRRRPSLRAVCHWTPSWRTWRPRRRCPRRKALPSR